MGGDREVLAMLICWLVLRQLKLVPRSVLTCANPEERWEKPLTAFVGFSAHQS